MERTKRKPTFTRHPDAIACEEWLEENSKSLDSSTLGEPRERNKYLENRLIAAWQAGVKYGRSTTPGAGDAGA